MRILLADDHALFRDGVASLVGAWGHEVVGLASTGEDAVDLAARLAPECILMDVRMPGIGGIEATRRITALSPGASIVMLTVSEDETDLFEAIRAGARGYLLKNLEATELRTMLAAVQRGDAAISPATAARILTLLAEPGRNRGPDELTERELDVLRGVTDGLRNKEIAAALGITENTVKYHLRNILEKLHAGSRTEVAALAVREGLATPRGPFDPGRSAPVSHPVEPGGEPPA